MPVKNNIVLEQLQESSSEDPSFKPLLAVMRDGKLPHGGLGMALERLTQKFLGLNNVKEATLFPRDINRPAP